jgi:N-acetylmuramoyl-L-alanine amidase
MMHKEIILHCAATPEGKIFDISDIDRWHKARGWKGCGYHFVITLDGCIQKGRAINAYGAHTKGRNSAIGICYIGGLDSGGVPKDTRTPEQRDALELLITGLNITLGALQLHGHNEYSNKACPSFDVKEETHLHHLANYER